MALPAKAVMAIFDARREAADKVKPRIGASGVVGDPEAFLSAEPAGKGLDVRQRDEEPAQADQLSPHRRQVDGQREEKPTRLAYRRDQKEMVPARFQQEDREDDE